MSLWSELKRRNVVRMAILYIVSAWLILQMADLLFDLMGVPDWALRMVLALLILGLPVAVVFSWLYELTPEGVKRESQVPPEHSITPRTGRKLNQITLIVGLIAIVLVSYQQFVGVPGVSETTSSSDSEQPSGAEPDDAQPPSIAVLPFINMSGNEENEYFSDGLTETLLHSLARIPDLQVAARTSSFAFKGKDTDIREIAGALGVAHVLEGSVQRAGDRVRITAQLIRASDGFHVWSENFDRTLDDIFAIQDEIAGEVGQALSKSLLGEPEELSDLVDSGTTNLKAYDLYLQALADRAQGSFASLQRAEQRLEAALAEDPNFIDAKVQLSILYGEQSSIGMREQTESSELATALLQQALAVRPDDITARTEMVMLDAYREFMSGNTGIVPGLIDDLRSLVAEAPSETAARAYLAVVYRMTGDDERAMAELRRLIEIDPLNPRYYNDLANVYHDLEDWPAANASLRRSLEIEPLQPSAQAQLAHFARHTGDVAAFLEHRIHAMELDPQDHELPAFIATFLYRFGLADQADWFLSRAEAISPASPVVRQAQLERAFRSGDGQLADDIARDMIAQDLENRHNSDAAACLVLFRNAVLHGRVEDALTFVEQTRPGFRSIGDSDVPFPAFEARLAALGAFYLVLTQAELDMLADGIVDTFAMFGDNLSNSSVLRVQLFALRGQIEEAIAVALEDLFSEPATLFTYWDLPFEQPHLAEVVKDPRIQAAMAARRDEEAQKAEAMRRYFAEQTAFGIPL